MGDYYSNKQNFAIKNAQYCEYTWMLSTQNFA